MSREDYIKNKMSDRERRELAKKLNLYFLPDYEVRDHPLNPKFSMRNKKMKEAVENILERESDYGDEWYERRHLRDQYGLTEKQVDALVKVMNEKDPDFVRSILRKKKSIKLKPKRKPVKKCRCKK